MKQVNLWAFYILGVGVRPLVELQVGVRLSDLSVDLIWADTALKDFANYVEVPLPLTANIAEQLHKAVLEARGHLTQDNDAMITFSEYYGLSETAKRFEHVIRAEIAGVNAYHFPARTAYNTTILIERGEEVIYESLRPLLSQMAMDDLREATKCLAFGLPTAVGFHTMRAVEATIIDYLRVLNIPAPTKKNERNLGKYIELLKSAGVDPKILLPLDQIRAFHRNELMHPDQILSDEEAASIFEVSKAALTAMLIGIKAQAANQPAPSTPPALPPAPSGAQP